MTSKYRAPLLAAALAMILGNTASAETSSGFYFGLTGGLVSTDIGSKSDFDEGLAIPIAQGLLAVGFDDVDIESSLDDSDIGWGLEIGYRFNRYIAAELGYLDLGEMAY